VEPRHVAAAWLDAYNGRDLERLLELSEPDFVMDGLAGEQRGHDALRERLTGPMHGVSVVVRPIATWHGGELVVIETVSEVRYGDTTEPGESMSGAATFTVRDGKVARMSVVDDLGQALRDAGLER
jgi:ketosteroid isomerase-like protein